MGRRRHLYTRWTTRDDLGLLTQGIHLPTMPETAMREISRAVPAHGVVSQITRHRIVRTGMPLVGTAIRGGIWKQSV